MMIHSFIRFILLRQQTRQAHNHRCLGSFIPQHTVAHLDNNDNDNDNNNNDNDNNDSQRIFQDGRRLAAAKTATVTAAATKDTINSNKRTSTPAAMATDGNNTKIRRDRSRVLLASPATTRRVSSATPTTTPTRHEAIRKTSTSRRAAPHPVPVLSLLAVALVLLLGDNRSCHGFSFPAGRGEKAVPSPPPPPSESEPGRWHGDEPPPEASCRQPRRRFVSSILRSSATALLLGTSFSPAAGAVAPGANDSSAVVPQRHTTAPRIVRLSSGLQFSDARVGSGPEISIPPSNDNDNDGDNDNDENPGLLLLHVRALRKDGSVLLDTLENGRPLVFVPGSIPAEELYYLGEGSALARGVLPLGVQDAILAPGTASWEGGYGKADPMRYGGIRRAVLPPELAYGNRGVSRYEAYRLGLGGPVARNEVLRYEIEILRCGRSAGSDGSSSEETGPASGAARACCREEFYPCRPGRA